MPNVRVGSLATDAFRASVEQWSLLPQWRTLDRSRGMDAKCGGHQAQTGIEARYNLQELLIIGDDGAHQAELPRRLKVRT